MPPKYDAQTKAIREFQASIPQKGLLAASIIGWYMEGRLFQQIHHNAFIIRSTEGASVDGCVLVIVSASEESGTSNTDRLMQILDWEDKKVPFEIMTFDVKGASIIAASRGNVIRFRTRFISRAKQNANCTFYVVVLRENSRYVALLSPECFIRKANRGQQKISGAFWEIPRRLVQFIDYIPEAIPWTIHIDELSKVLQDLRDQRKQGLPLTIKGIPLMTKGRTTTSTKLIADRKGELEVIRFFHKIFKNHPDFGLSLHLLDFRPLFADFWINSRDSARALIELKGTYAHSLYIRQNGWVEHVSFTHCRTTSIFHSGRPWDHLLTLNYALREFYLIPFDHIPPHWRDDTVRSTANGFPERKNLRTEYVKVRQADLERFRMQLGDAGWLQKVVQILQIRRSPRNEYDVSRLYTTEEKEPGEVAELQTMIDGDEFITEEERDETEEPDFVSEESVSDETPEAIFLGSVFQQEVLEKLMYDSAMSMRGLYFYLGHSHPVADFVFVQYLWTDQEQQAYLSCRKMPIHIAELTDMTRVVLLSAHQGTAALNQTGGLSTTTASVYRFFRQLPAIMLFATSQRMRIPAYDEPVNFLPVDKLLTPKNWTLARMNETRKFHDRRRHQNINDCRLDLKRGNPVTHSIRLSEVHFKMLRIIRGDKDFQVGIDPAQTFPSTPYLLPWKTVKRLHAENLYAIVNAK